MADQKKDQVEASALLSAVLPLSQLEDKLEDMVGYAASIQLTVRGGLGQIKDVIDRLSSKANIPSVVITLRGLPKK